MSRWIAGLVVAVSSLGGVRIAAAEPPGATAPVPAPRDDDTRSTLTAFEVSALATIGGVAIGSLGLEAGPASLRDASGVFATAALVLGPSAGHWYAGRRVTTGLVLRASAIGGLAALALADPHLDHVATAFGIIGAIGVFETGFIWDIVTLPRAVRRYNREHAVVIGPLATPGGGGVALGGTF